ncbi:purine-cytosine permease family protein [Arthrobacter pascens]|uniref:purine-cytosine permease family protein n=1 Tax=Arthrobacter pascens TaxID=1677 RepID=UPI00196A850E|nr:cytosine permease [Arthrobacter pascens]MBN3496616.1 cytosine permease [Arthrobacter pascens]MDR6558442.1 cytosine permease [Arthrobacter pascens]
MATTTDKKHAGEEDYALERVPDHARYSWWSVAVQRFGQMSALSQFLLGAALGFGMDFPTALLAIFLGSVILEVVAIMTGILGQKEGLSTSILARWTGFGRHGSSIIALFISLSLVGWFGVQSGVAAEGLAKLAPVIPAWAWALVVGGAVTAIVIYGFKSMAWTAYITIPAFLLLAGWSIVSELQRHDLGDLVNQPAPGPVLSLAAGTTLVAGGFIVGMVITPDMTRFNRKPSDVIKQTLLGVTLGEFMVAIAGVLLAHALKTNDIIAIVTSSSGFVGTIIIVAGTIKMNDWNLYSASLGIVNFVETVFKKRVSRTSVTIFIGILGSALAAAGILNYFVDFLILLGVTFPPIAGIMVAEYYIVKKWRSVLSASAPGLPATEPTWVIGTLVVWAASVLIGTFLPWGVGSLNSLGASLILYVIAGKLGLIKGTSEEALSRRSITEERALQEDYT